MQVLVDALAADFDIEAYLAAADLAMSSDLEASEALMTQFTVAFRMKTPKKKTATSDSGYHSITPARRAHFHADTSMMVALVKAGVFFLLSTPPYDLAGLCVMDSTVEHMKYDIQVDVRQVHTMTYCQLDFFGDVGTLLMAFCATGAGWGIESRGSCWQCHRWIGGCCQRYSHRG
jgi:hypothetical protein